MENRGQMEAQKDLKAAMSTLESHGITLTFKTESEVKARQNYLAGLVEPIRFEAKEKSQRIATTYLDRNKFRRSVIIFKEYDVDYPGSSTVIMPNAAADYDEVVRLIKAIRRIILCNDIIIDDLYDQPVPADDSFPF